MTSRILKNREVASSLELLSAWIEAQMAYGGQPGLSIGIVHDQTLLWTRGFGFADVQTEKPATADTIYRIASITKLFTTTAIMQLRDEGKLQLDDPLNKHLPWFSVQNRFADAPVITIRHLLTHTSGLPRESAFPYWVEAEFPSIEQIREALPTQEVSVATETKWKYSNLALTLAGEVVAAVSGMAYTDYIERFILRPLRMNDTFISPVEPDHPQLATGYGRRLPDGSRAVSPYTDCRGITPAANMASTVEDLARFAMLHLRDGRRRGKQVLRGSSLREMQRVHWLNPDWSAGRGLGFYVWRLHGRTLSGHGGALQGYRTDLQICPEDKIAAVVLTNADDGNPLLVMDKVFQWVVPAVVKAAAPRPQVVEAKDVWQRYAGKYRNVWGDTQVLLQNGGLVMLDPSMPDPALGLSKLIPIDESSFRLETEANFGNDGEVVIFETDERGDVTRIKLGNNYTYPVNEW